MEANRLADFRSYAEMGNVVVAELIEHIDQQQAEIERLNRAYEVLRKYMSASPFASKELADAQRIKDGKDGEQG